MKIRITLALLGVLFAFQNAYSQITLVDINDVNYQIDSLWMDAKSIHCFNVTIHQPMEYSKKQIRKIIRENDTIYISLVEQQSSSNFGRLNTLNYTNGSLETGIVEKITMDSIYFRVYGDYPIISIDNKKINFLNYGNGIIEYFRYGHTESLVSDYKNMKQNISKSSKSSSKSYWGITMGYSRTYIKLGDNLLVTDPYNGFNGGVNWTLFIAQKKSISFTLKYIKKGINFLALNTSNSSNGFLKNQPLNYQIHFIEFPILYQFRIPIQKIFLEFESGLYFNFKIKEKTEGFPQSSQIRGYKNDLGLPIGMGIYIPYQNNYIHLALQYSWGFFGAINSYSDPFDPFADEYSGSLNCFSMNFTYLLPIKK